MRLWQDAHIGLSRCTLSTSRSAGSMPWKSLSLASSAGTFAGGGGGGVPRKFASTNRPRFTGEVRSGFDVTSSALPCVSMPPRGLPAGSVTLRSSSPVTSGMP